MKIILDRNNPIRNNCSTLITYKFCCSNNMSHAYCSSFETNEWDFFCNFYVRKKILLEISKNYVL